MAQNMESARANALAALAAKGQGTSVSQEVRQLINYIVEDMPKIFERLEELKREGEEERRDLQTVLTNQGTILSSQAKILDLLQKIYNAVEPPKIAAIVFGWNGEQQTYQLPDNPSEVIKMSDFSFSDSDSATANLSVVDQDGNAITSLTTPPSWTPDSTTFGTLNVSADGFSATVVPTQGQGVGTTNVTIQVTNDDGTAASPATTSFTTTQSDAGTVTAVWSDSGPTVTTPPATS